MENTIWLRPASPDVKVRHPFTKQFLPDEGMEVAREPYWDRRMIDGDVVEMTPKEAVAPAKSPSAKKPAE